MATQTIYGKAFEYACIIALERFINSHPGVEVKANIIHNPVLSKARIAFVSLPKSYQCLLLNAGTALSRVLGQTEPRLLYRTAGLQNRVELSLQPDARGMQGDVRDVLVVRIVANTGNGWEIGISVKHNHDAVKHQRVSPTIDIGKEWIGFACDKQYWADIEPVFNYTSQFAGLIEWRNLKDKEKKVYQPILEAVGAQLLRLYEEHGEQCVANLLHYLIGKNDFYKAIVYTRRKNLMVQGFNINGTLGLPSLRVNPSVKPNLLKMPSKLYEIEFVGSSLNKIRIVMDQGWQISMRVHNATTMVENSLKMDVRLEGVPPNIFTQTVNF